MGAVLESADTEAVRAFLNGRISFTDISKVALELYEKMKIAKAYTSLEEIINAHNEARAKTKEIIEKMSKRH